ncbi:MAG: glycosyltransferase family A protein [Trueperaceae bacterium]
MSSPTPRPTDPFFSVVIPTRDRDDLLREALESVRRQTERDFEVIVVDDAGTASTRALVASFDGLGVTYIVNDHAHGGAGTRNAGAERASGSWIAFLDDDDTWLPTRLQRVRALIERSDDALGLVYTAHAKYDFDARRVISTTRPTVRGRVLQDVLYRNFVGGLSVVVVRRAAFLQVGGFDERFPSLQDMELYVRVAQGWAFDYVDEVLAHIRQGRAGRISTNAAKKLEGGRLFAEKYENLIHADRRLRHRTAARTFAFALAAADGKEIARNAWWATAGLVFDPGNTGFVVRTLARHLRSRIGARLEPRTSAR